MCIKEGDNYSHTVNNSEIRMLVKEYRNRNGRRTEREKETVHLT